jgi:hypothetical protein
MKGLIRKEEFWVFLEGSGGDGYSTRPWKQRRKRPNN